MKKNAQSVKNHQIPLYVWVSLILFSLTLLSFSLISSFTVSADSSVDDVAIIVPVSCSLAGANINHTATINNGTYQNNIGLSTIQAYCNDIEGFAIYAIGYTNDTEGENVLTNSTLDSDHNIITGTATSGSNSNWVMKLDTDSNATYPITIENNFSDYHTVPDEYTLVAKRDASTDVGQSATGSTLTSTYQVYISPTQAAGTYQGKVKYVLVHPSTAPAPVNENQVGVIFDGNGLTFPGGTTTNRVVYETTCDEEYGYVSNTYQEVMFSNISTGGVKNEPYSDSEDILQNIPLNGAKAVKIVIDYGVTIDTMDIDFIGGDWDGDWENYNWSEWQDHYFYSEDNISGTETFVLNLDSSYTLTIRATSWEAPVAGYDYGFYAKIYPIYDEPTEGSVYSLIQRTCSYHPVSGTYAETTTWNEYWFKKEDDDDEYPPTFSYEEDLMYYLVDNEELLGTTIVIYAHNPYTINYDGNNATAGTMNGFYNDLGDNITKETTTTLIAPNFYKTGYGFAGWSENPNATVNGSSKIYGPNEEATEGELNFDATTHETTLYAVWVPSSGNMQNWSGCSSMSKNQVTALTDNRDNNVYTVGKLADGNCWMMENLRLDNTATLSSSNTNNPAAGFALAATSDNWGQSENASSINQSKLNTNNTNIGGVNSFGATLFSTPYIYKYDGYSNRGDQSQWYSYGNYYNWYSATAGNGTYNTQFGIDVAGDICPTGWSLPTYRQNDTGEEGQFPMLDIALGGTGHYRQGPLEAFSIWREFPQNFVYVGDINTGGASDTTGVSEWHYATRSTSHSSNAHEANSFSIYPKNDGSSYFGLFSRWKTSGLAIRCLTNASN